RPSDPADVLLHRRRGGMRGGWSLVVVPGRGALGIHGEGIPGGVPTGTHELLRPKPIPGVVVAALRAAGEGGGSSDGGHGVSLVGACRIMPGWMRSGSGPMTPMLPEYHWGQWAATCAGVAGE